eukprot:1148881-Pelagomonas_calceolata.AAC.14
MMLQQSRCVQHSEVTSVFIGTQGFPGTLLHNATRLCLSWPQLWAQPWGRMRTDVSFLHCRGGGKGVHVIHVSLAEEGWHSSGSKDPDFSCLIKPTASWPYSSPGHSDVPKGLGKEGNWPHKQNKEREAGAKKNSPSAGSKR